MKTGLREGANGGMGVSPIAFSEENAGETPTPPAKENPLKS